MGESSLRLLCIAYASSSSIDSLANQEVLRWQLAMQKELGDNITHQHIKDYLWKTLNSGQVVPGLVSITLFPPEAPVVNNSQLRAWRLTKVRPPLHRAPGIL